MAEEQATRGPYLEWLRHARRHVGERVWDQIVKLPCHHADTLLQALGVISWEHSVERYRQIYAVGESKDGVCLSLRTVKSQGDRRTSGEPRVVAGEALVYHEPEIFVEEEDWDRE